MISNSYCKIYDDISISKIISCDLGIFRNNFSVNFYDTYDEWCKFLNKSFIDKLRNAGPLDRLMVFNKPNNWVNQSAHIDGDKIAAINLVYCHASVNKFYKKSYMEWFKVVNYKPKNIMMSNANTPYLNYEPDEIELVFRECLDNKLSLVRVDVPHRIKIGFGHRTCFSLRYKKKFANWNEAVDFFDNNLNEILKDF